LDDLRKDALQFYSPTWNAAFYDSIAQYVPNYVPTSGRTTFKARVSLPKGAIKPIAVLATSGVDFQDNVIDTKGYQYWGDIDTLTGTISIPRVAAGTYRLTIYAEGIFGDYTQDNITITAGEVHTLHATWHEETSGTEIFRVGVPDKSSGEFKHGYAPDLTRTNHPEQYRNYWAVYDFPTEFPSGVVYTVGQSDPAKDFNYVHWSVFGGYANSLRPQPYYENVNNWTILFDLEEGQVMGRKEATFTVLLAGAKTAAGNTDVYNASEPFANLPYTVVVNGRELEPWIIP
jgi:rhamnogalacturonan endolyase